MFSLLKREAEGFFETVGSRDAAVEPTGVRPIKEKRQWRFSRPNGLATDGEPRPCKRNRIV